MSKDTFHVRLSPREAMEVIVENENADLVHQEIHDLNDAKSICTLVFEKYFFRTKSRAALVVIMYNFQSTTEVRVVATGSSDGLIFNFDWGAADTFASTVREILSDTIL